MPEDNSKLFEEVFAACKYILEHDQVAAQAKKYLQERNIKEFEFGYFPTNDHLSYLVSLVDKSVLNKLGLVYSRFVSGGVLPNGHFNNHNLIFPFYNMYGEIISFVGRTFHSKEKQDELQIPKYKYNYGLNKELLLFGLNKSKEHIIDKDLVILVEGQFDFFSCYESGIKNVVALGGASCSKYQFAALRRYTKNFLLLLDGDEAGERAAGRIKETFGKYANIIKKKPPGGFKDIDEFLKCDDIVRKENYIRSLATMSGSDLF